MGKTLSPSQQWFRLKSSPISRGHGFVRNGLLTWEFDAKPNSLSRTYHLQIRYAHRGTPSVIVLSPDIVSLADGRKLPHVYSMKPVRLCLYFPSSDEWSSDKSFTETIVPWTYLWLHYFEHWLTTDDWLGGGKHPGDSDATE